MGWLHSTFKPNIELELPNGPMHSAILPLSKDRLSDSPVAFDNLKPDSKKIGKSRIRKGRPIPRAARIGRPFSIYSVQKSNAASNGIVNTESSVEMKTYRVEKAVLPPYCIDSATAIAGPGMAAMMTRIPSIVGFVKMPFVAHQRNSGITIMR